MSKVKVPIKDLCQINPDNRAIVIESLRAVRKQPLPAKTLYWLNKISVVVEKEFAEYESARISLVMRLGEANGTGYVVPEAKRAEFEKELGSLDHEVELPIEDGVKLPLPVSGVPDDWFQLMRILDIFEEPK